MLSPHSNVYGGYFLEDMRSGWIDDYSFLSKSNVSWRFFSMSVIRLSVSVLKPRNKFIFYSSLITIFRFNSALK
jgi:hypothetical protein